MYVCSYHYIHTASQAAAASVEIHSYQNFCPPAFLSDWDVCRMFECPLYEMCREKNCYWDGKVAIEIKKGGKKQGCSYVGLENLKYIRIFF